MAKRASILTRIEGVPPGAGVQPSGWGAPVVSYGYGRPRPGLVQNLAALFGGKTAGPRVTGPWQYGPKAYVGASGAPDAQAEVGTAGGHVWGPRAGDPGFPSGSAWPGWPDDWSTPYFTSGEDPSNRRHVLTKRISTVWACVDLISREISTMPTQIKKRARPVTPKTWQVNPEPLVYASWVDFAKAVVNSALIRGESVIAATGHYADGYPARFVCLNPDMVHIEPEANGLSSYWLGGTDGVPLPREDICHIRYQVWPGHHRGIGPLEACWRNLASAEAMESYASALAGRGGIPSAVLQSAVPLRKEQATDIKQSWRESVMGSGVEPVVLTSSLAYTPLTISPKDMALLDTRLFDEQRIASAFGVPLWLVGLPMADGLTYTTVEGTWDYFWRANLRPLGHNIAAALSAWLLPTETHLNFDADELTRPGIVQRAQAYETLIRAGVMLPDEARIEEGYFPLEEQDIDVVAKTAEGKPG